MLGAALLSTRAYAGDDLAQIVQRGQLRVLVPIGGEQFLPRHGRPDGEDHELAQALAKALGVRLDFVPVERFDQLIPKLEAGEGDIVAAQLTVTPARQKRVAFSTPLLVTQEVLVGKRGVKGHPRRVSKLKGKQVHVRVSSSYAQSLQALNRRLRPQIEIVAADEQLEDEELLYQVSEGKVPYTVVDEHVLRSVQTYNPELRSLVRIAKRRKIAWAMRKDAPRLLQRVNAFLKKNRFKHLFALKSRVDLAGIKRRGMLRVLTRNNSRTYFLYRGHRAGFEFELCQHLAKVLGVRLEVVVAPSWDQLIPWLRQGKGDLIASSLTRTKERESKVAFSEPYLSVEELLLKKKGREVGVQKLADLADRKVHVRKSSSYYRTLAAQKVPITIVEEPESLTTEQIIEKVSTAQIMFTVADSHILAHERTYRDDVESVLALSKNNDIALAVRRNNPKLLAAVNSFLKTFKTTPEFAAIEARYYRAHRRANRQEGGVEVQEGRISAHDALFKKYGQKYGFDWAWLAAIAYEESRFDPAVKSWMGGQGLFGLTPRTVDELGFASIESVEDGVHAGAKMLDRLRARFEKDLPQKQRLRFALAAFNVGLGHVRDARRLAASQGLDPNKWFGHVEKAMMLLRKPEFANRARYGLFRAEEPVTYVSDVETRFRAWKTAGRQSER